MAVPSPTDRLRFRCMELGDLDAMADLLGDAEGMRFYQRPKTRSEARDWIEWNRRGYAERGHGLWIVETLSGEFVGDCGLTLQAVNGRQRLEVGYHVVRPLQGQGYASEAATACRDFARAVLAAPELIAITHPLNTASQRVAEKIGMHRIEDDLGSDLPIRVVLGMRFEDGRAL